MALDPVKACQYRQSYATARAAQVAKAERQKLVRRPLWVYWCVNCAQYHLTQQAMDWGR